MKKIVKPSGRLIRNVQDRNIRSERTLEFIRVNKRTNKEVY